jgi:FKBP-type peptidyl-prolyl cis-trans isomerase FkpA
MKKILIGIIAGLFLITFFNSCLKNNFDTPDPTYEQEQSMLKAYIDTLIANGRDVDTTQLGIYYIVLEEGEGEVAKTGDSLTVGYSGYFVDGRLFDSSQYNNNEGTIEFVLGELSFISGWEDALRIMNKNSKMQFVIPSDLAYGSAGQGVIPPYTTLVFVIKMVDIKPSN